MAIVINGSGEILGISVGGLPDGIVDAGTLATNSVDSAELIDGAVDDSHMASIKGRKNILYNGAMKISQRGTSFAAIGNTDYSLDRWSFQNSTIGTYTVTQDSSGPAGFANSYKIDCTTADASPAAGDQMYIKQKIEGQDVQHLKKGTASAESITASFWVKSNKTGDMQVNLYDKDNTRIIGNTVTINAADTWEQKSLTFAGDTTGAFNDDNAQSLQIELWFDSGSNYSSGAVPTSWEARVEADRNAGGTLALADSTSNYLNFTGVQLEVGSTATDFEHRSYGEELALCQRYYQKYENTGNINANDGALFNTCVWNTTDTFSAFVYINPMRTSPSVGFSDTTANSLTLFVAGSSSTPTSWAINNSSDTRLEFLLKSSSLTTGEAGWVRLSANKFMYLDAEL
jgi:hypothetical protein